MRSRQTLSKLGTVQYECHQTPLPALTLEGAQDNLSRDRLTPNQPFAPIAERKLTAPPINLLLEVRGSVDVPWIGKHLV